ncbi:hypothetical protein BST36_23300 [Mycolicibacterium moriokaense]|uniref:TetR family transcriptional regulator n=1 Tax=Mycolicibacterium moriokaense TaxID=39691 RepID=A0AAD1H7I7_9MYCO|nr:TetR/AcrR family transcriptional regulator [Mycolicibacterium moriokaense]MCV7039195.1 TetR/AcrR family transcriptional regulator [Mycolicibacterium moriokaense]ORB18524.1 hypothetical protein BST36_23300 [Mycolicibacterium moriokaense]BBX00100.1 TetR family transcriptional regulator [Mycolicibacterium moriokaense]
MSALRERKKAALRSTIVRCAVELFMARGYDAVGMEDIAAAAVCSRSTLNRYFGTKEDVLFATAPEVTERLRTALENVETDDRWTVARREVTSQLAQFFDNMDSDLRVDIMRLWYSEPPLHRRYLSFVSEWEDILKRFFAQGLPEDTANRLRVQLLSTAMASALRSVAHTAVLSGEDIDTLADVAFGMLEAGLLTKPAL